METPLGLADYHYISKHPWVDLFKNTVQNFSGSRWWSTPLRTRSIVDFPALEAVGVRHVINPDFGGDLLRNLDIPEFKFDEYGVSRPIGLNPPVDKLSDCGNNVDDEEARLRDRLKQLQIEKHVCLRKKRIVDLKRMVQEEETTA